MYIVEFNQYLLVSRYGFGVALVGFLVAHFYI